MERIELVREANKLQSELLAAADMLPNPLARALIKNMVGRLHFLLCALINDKGA